ncbi:phage terminase large subunit family protein [Endozoicomonas sp. YOMI1]|uniref:phage terminase large subunit family protein n=1 Tax=Endozoicomonas sp. YOMI1 TaxID=2828739 RepID=UPI002147F177|nr:phage terminase large subunit family protein [Endozoicomonas sp. YOMI1]
MNSPYFSGFFSGLEPDTRLTVSEWADQKRILPAKATKEIGRCRTARTPYLKEIMDCLSPSSPVEQVVFMKGAQVGGTECGNNWLGYVFPNGVLIFTGANSAAGLRLMPARFLFMDDSCGHYQLIVWAQIIFDNHDPSTTRFECVQCGHKHYEKDKTKLLTNGHWQAEKEKINKSAGFHRSSPLQS